jgi:hypothetical protein
VSQVIADCVYLITSIYRESPEGLSFLLSGESFSMESNKYEEAIQKLGNIHIQKEKAEYEAGIDKISKEIASYKAKYGRKWYSKYCEDSYMLALNEQKERLEAVG